MADARVTPELLDPIAERFRALGETSRLRILHALRSGGPRTVTELVRETRLGQTNVSKHLAVLRHVGLVERHRDGLFVQYGIRDARLYTLCDLMRDLPSERPEVVGAIRARGG